MSQGISFTCSIPVDVSCPFILLFHKGIQGPSTGISGIHLVYTFGKLGPVDDCCHFRRHVKEVVGKESAFMHGLEAC